MASVITIPPSCVSEYWVRTRTLTTTDFRGNSLDIGINLGNPWDPSCWPVGLGAIASATACPSGYASACPASGFNVVGQSAFDCCPSGYFCDGGAYSCSSHFSSMSTFTAKDMSSGTTVTITATQDGMNAHSIRIMHSVAGPISTTSTTTTSVHSSSSAGSESTAGTPSNSLASTSTGATTSTTSTPPISTSGSSTPELSTGAQAGIGVAAASAVIAVLALLFVAYKSKRSAARRQNQSFVSHGQFADPPPNQASGLYAAAAPEMSHSGPGVMPTPSTFHHEMDSPPDPALHELETPRYSTVVSSRKYVG